MAALISFAVTATIDNGHDVNLAMKRESIGEDCLNPKTSDL
jgi:hypothetical protein